MIAATPPISIHPPVVGGTRIGSRNDNHVASDLLVHMDQRKQIVVNVASVLRPTPIEAPQLLPSEPISRFRPRLSSQTELTMTRQARMVQKTMSLSGDVTAPMIQNFWTA